RPPRMCSRSPPRTLTLVREPSRRPSRPSRPSLPEERILSPPLRALPWRLPSFEAEPCEPFWPPCIEPDPRWVDCVALPLEPPEPLDCAALEPPPPPPPDACASWI